MVCVERLTKKMSVPRRKNLNLLDLNKKNYYGVLMILNHCFLFQTFTLALLYIGTIL